MNDVHKLLFKYCLLANIGTTIHCAHIDVIVFFGVILSVKVNLYFMCQLYMNVIGMPFG